MSLLALTLADFQAQLPFSKQIEDAQLRPFIDLTRTLELGPLLGAATLEAVDALPAIGPVIAYAEGLVFEPGQLVNRRERLYRAAENALLPIVPPPTDGKAADPWAYDSLATLWLLYLKPWWVQQAFARFLPQHGKNLTKAGVTQARDSQFSTYDRPSSAERAELQASVDSTAEALKSQLLRFMREDRLLHTSCGCGYNYFPDVFAGPRAASLHRTRLRGINNPRR